MNDEVRKWVTYIIIGTWALSIIAILLLWALPGGISSTDAKDALKSFSGVTSGLVGVIIGYYFTNK